MIHSVEPAHKSHFHSESDSTGQAVCLFLRAARELKITAVNMLVLRHVTNMKIQASMHLFTEFENFFHISFFQPSFSNFSHTNTVIRSEQLTIRKHFIIRFH